MDVEKRGGCLCGAVRFKVRGELGPVVGCHCSQCRRQTGLYYAATDVDRYALEIDGEVTWYRASDQAGRGFCGTCGSALFWLGDGARHISIMAGAFEDSSGLVFGYHIYCADKADFYEIDDGLPRYAAGRPRTRGI